MKAVTAIRPMMPTGILMKKVQRQLNQVTMNPPTGGPTTGPNRAGTVSHAMAATNSDFVAVRNSSRRPTGTIIAPPMPCKTRETTSSANPFDKPHSTDPTVNTMIAARKTFRVPNRSATHPLAGMNTVRLSK